jgi:hypothetical protein
VLGQWDTAFLGKEYVDELMLTRVRIMSEWKVIGMGAMVDKNMDTMDDVYCS